MILDWADPIAPERVREKNDNCGMVLVDEIILNVVILSLLPVSTTLLRLK